MEVNDVVFLLVIIRLSILTSDRNKNNFVEKTKILLKKG